MIRRVPAASARLILEAENVVIRLKKPDIRTHVICPGILYGDGEDDAGFHSLWRLSWEAQEDLDVLGPGKYYILYLLKALRIIVYKEGGVMMQGSY